VGSAKERFDEDRLRILRAIRFAARMGSKLDPETEAAILEDNSLEGVSPERIRDEFLKSISSAKSVQNLLWMYEHFDLWSQVFPGLSVNNQYQETKNVPLLLALLLRDNDPKSLGKKVNKLKYSVVETRQIIFLALFQVLQPDSAYKLKKLWVPTQLSEADLEEFARLNNGKPPTRLVKAFNKYTPTVSGQELMDQGFKGRELGQELERRETELFSNLL
jgi:tRNA nucleotidyltransferase/poly(A) polymerase